MRGWLWPADASVFSYSLLNQYPVQEKKSIHYRLNIKTIGLSTPVKPSGLRRMLDALDAVFVVRFEERTLENDHEIDAWILYDADRETLHRITFCEHLCYMVIHGDQLVLRRDILLSNSRGTRRFHLC